MKRTTADLTRAEDEGRRATFVASSSALARDGFVIEATGWDVTAFERNPVLLWAHDQSQLPIGRVTSVRHEDGNLVADVEAPPEGEYGFADTVWRFIANGMLNAVSVGFIPRQMSNDGRRITSAELLELSVVPVPADQHALAIARAVAPDAPVDTLFARKAEPAPSGQTVDDAHRRHAPASPQRRITPMIDYVEKMRALENELAEAEGTLDTIVADAESEERDLSEAEQQRYDSLQAQVDALKARHERLHQRAQAKAAAAASREPTTTPEPGHTRGGALWHDPVGYGRPGAQVKAGKANREPGMLLVRLARETYKANGNHSVAAQNAENDGDHETATMIRAAVAGADSTTSGWASQLVDEEMGAFLDKLRPASVYARTPGVPVNVNSSKLKLPKLNTGVPGAFFSEGSPIPMAQGVFGQVEVAPFQMGVITTATQQLLNRASPDTDNILINGMIEDTARVLDGVFVSDAAEVTGTSPAGLRDGAGTRAATSAGTTATVEEIDGDVNIMMAALDAINAPQRRLQWIMAPANARALASKQTTAGQFPYKDQIEGEGRFKGIPLLTSTTMAAGVVILLDLDLLYKGNIGAPRVDLSTTATLHMETSPSNIVSGGSAAGGTVQSMWQTDQVAMRLILPTTWVKREDAGVQVLTGVTW